EPVQLVVGEVGAPVDERAARAGRGALEGRGHWQLARLHVGRGRCTSEDGHDEDTEPRHFATSASGLLERARRSARVGSDGREKRSENRLHAMYRPGTTSVPQMV